MIIISTLTTRTLYTLLPITYKYISKRLNKNAPKKKIIFYKLQDAGSEIGQKLKKVHAELSLPVELAELFRSNTEDK